MVKIIDVGQVGQDGRGEYFIDIKTDVLYYDDEIECFLKSRLKFKSEFDIVIGRLFGSNFGLNVEYPCFSLVSMKDRGVADKIRGVLLKDLSK